MCAYDWKTGTNLNDTWNFLPGKIKVIILRQIDSLLVMILTPEDMTSDTRNRGSSSIIMNQNIYLYFFISFFFLRVSSKYTQQQKNTKFSLKIIQQQQYWKRLYHDKNLNLIAFQWLWMKHANHENKSDSLSYFFPKIHTYTCIHTYTHKSVMVKISNNYQCAIVFLTNTHAHTHQRKDI